LSVVKAESVRATARGNADSLREFRTYLNGVQSTARAGQEYLQAAEGQTNAAGFYRMIAELKNAVLNRKR
jgi:hypothetical protein